MEVGIVLPGAICGGDGNSRFYGRRPAGVALRRALLRIPRARTGLRAVCAIVCCMNRRVFSFSLAILVTGGTCVAADLTEQYRATADKLIDAALADTEGYD